MPPLFIASPHRYPDLARLWHRFVIRDLAPDFARIGLEVEIEIFCDANESRFDARLFPGVVLSRSGPGARDFMEYYDYALRKQYEFLFFIDADVFFIGGAWASSYFQAFKDPNVAAISFVSRNNRPAIFALLCRAESYRALPSPVFACRYESPEIWPSGTNLQPGDFAARELAARGKTIVNIEDAESSQHVAVFRSTTGIRSTREHISRVGGPETFQHYAARNPSFLSAAYDNVLLGLLYERLFHEPFAVDGSGTSLGGSMTLEELRESLSRLTDGDQITRVRTAFRRSEQNIRKMATREGVQLTLPPSASLLRQLLR